MLKAHFLPGALNPVDKSVILVLTTNDKSELKQLSWNPDEQPPEEDEGRVLTPLEFWSHCGER